MAKVFKIFFVILGSILIGLGIGLIIPKSVQIEESYYWLVIIFTLIPALRHSSKTAFTPSLTGSL